MAPDGMSAEVLVTRGQLRPHSRTYGAAERDDGQPAPAAATDASGGTVSQGGAGQGGAAGKESVATRDKAWRRRVWYAGQEEGVL